MRPAPTSTQPPPQPAPGAGPTASQRQVRGSSVLLLGRLLSMAVNLGVQVLIVRHLSRAGFGSFAYAMSFVGLAETIVVFGLDRAVTRFVALYDERGEPEKVLGTVALVAGVILTMGAVLAAGLWATGDAVVGRVVADRQAVALLGVLMLLAPIQAFDSLTISLFAVFSRAGAIFVRRYVLVPGLRLVVVLVLVIRDADVMFLATGYVVAGGVGVLLILPLLVGVMREQGLFRRAVRRAIRVPVREILAFTVPLLTSDLVHAVMATSDALMLGWFRDAQAVGALRAVQPVAKLNLFVMSSFALLYTPAAARLFARADRPGLERLYWHTASWLAVLTFPVFIAGFALARPVTTTLFGVEYADSASYMALLALGYYVQVAFGFNGLTVKACGAVKIIVLQNVAAAVANIGLNLALIPRFGALGAALGTATALIFHNVLKQLGLRSVTGVSFVRPQTWLLYLTIFGSAALLLVAQVHFDLGLLVGLAIGALLSVLVFLVARPGLEAHETFPALLRLPGIRWLLTPR